MSRVLCAPNKILSTGFSLLEIMVVIVITAMISVVAIPNYKAYINKAKVTKSIAMIDFCKNDIYRYFVKNGSFPSGATTSSDNSQMVSCQGQILSDNFIRIPASDDTSKVQVKYNLNNNVARFTLIHAEVQENNNSCNIFVDLTNNNGDVTISCSTDCTTRGFFPASCSISSQ